MNEWKERKESEIWEKANNSFFDFFFLISKKKKVEIVFIFC